MVLDLLSYDVDLSQSQQNFPMKSQTVNRLGSAGHTVSVVTNRFCCWSTKAAIDNM